MAIIVLVLAIGVSGFLITKNIGKNYVNRNEMGKLVEKKVSIEMELSYEKSDKENVALRKVSPDAIKEYFPQNIFEALAMSYEIQLVMFSLFLGFTIGIIPIFNKEKGTCWIVAKSKFQDGKLVLRLLNEKVLKNIEKDPDCVRFDVSMTDENPLRERLEQLEGIEIGPILAVWQQAYDSSRKTAMEALHILEVIYETFFTMVKVFLYLLPVGMFLLIGGLVATQKEQLVEIVKAMGFFVICFNVIGFLIIILSSIIIWLFSDSSFGKAMGGLWKPFSTAFSSMSSFAAMTVAIEVLKDELEFEETTSSLYLSLFLPIFRFGNAFYFILATSFFAIVYSPDFSKLDALLLSFYSMGTSFYTIGTTSILAIKPITGLFNEFGLPSGAGFVLLVAVDTIINPIRTALIVQCNIAVAAVLADTRSQKRNVIKFYGVIRKLLGFLEK